MNLEEYQIMHQVEDTLWWYKGMEIISRAVLEKNYSRGGKLKILDAGCGTGGVMKYLADYGNVTGLDISSYAQSRRGHQGGAAGPLGELAETAGVGRTEVAISN